MTRRLALALLLTLQPAPAGAQDAGGTLVIGGNHPRDVYAAGGQIDVPGDVEGDVVVAARAVTVTGVIRADLLAAAHRLLIAGRVLDDVRAAARLVALEGEVGDGLLAAAEVVRLTPASRVGGTAWIAARRVELAGRMAGPVHAAAARVRIAGTLDGDVELAARDIEIMPGARIAGNLTYWSTQEARIAPGAQVAGRVERRQLGFLDRAGRVLTILGVITRVVFVLNLFVAGVVLLFFFPRLTISAAATVGHRPWASFGMGLAVLVVTPLAALALVFTVVGIPLALTLAWLYMLGVLLGFLTASFYLAEVVLRALRRATRPPRGARIAALAVVLVALAAVRFVPVAGPLVLVLLLIVGVGAWTLRLSRSYSGIPEEEGVRP